MKSKKTIFYQIEEWAYEEFNRLNLVLQHVLDSDKAKFKILKMKQYFNKIKNNSLEDIMEYKEFLLLLRNAEYRKAFEYHGQFTWWGTMPAFVYNTLYQLAEEQDYVV